MMRCGSISPRFLTIATSPERLSPAPSATGSRAPRALHAAGGALAVAVERAQDNRAGQPRPRMLYRRSEASHEQEDDHDQEDQSEPAARIIPPVSTVRPGRESPNQHQNQDNDQDRGQRHNGSFFSSDGIESDAFTRGPSLPKVSISESIGTDAIRPPEAG